MRMPLLAYFSAVGAVLTGLLLLLTHHIEPVAPPVQTSQVIGVPKPFKATPEPPPDLTGLNFAAEHEQPTAMPVTNIDVPRKQKATSRNSPPPTPNWNRLAEFPHDNLSIH